MSMRRRLDDAIDLETKKLLHHVLDHSARNDGEVLSTSALVLSALLFRRSEGDKERKNGDDSTRAVISPSPLEMGRVDHAESRCRYCGELGPVNAFCPCPDGQRHRGEFEQRTEMVVGTSGGRAS